MREETVLRQHLEQLKTVLQRVGDDHWGLIDRALGGSEENLRAFLISNELWGGAGSIADQAGYEQGREVKRLIEAAMINLGEWQIEAGIANARTGMWVDVFHEWQRNGI